MRTTVSLIFLILCVWGDNDGIIKTNCCFLSPAKFALANLILLPKSMSLSIESHSCSAKPGLSLAWQK